MPSGLASLRHMTSPSAPSTGGELFLDTELAQAAVTELQKVYDKLDALRTQAHGLARPDRTARDMVSSEAFDLLASKAAGGPGSFVAAVTGGMKHVEQLINQMQADIAAQLRVDEEARRRIAQT